MSARPCQRTWQAEAAEDGRLSAADRASFERHAELCGTCAAERSALVRVREVAERMPRLNSTPLRRRFLHNELLRKANARQLGALPRPPARRSWWVASAAFAVALAFAGALVLRGTPPPNAPRAALQLEPEFTIAASSGGEWRRVRAGSALRLALTPGTYTVWVKKLRAGQRFVLELPDGELEVRGTRFIVRVRSSTHHVEVNEGRVVLRLHGLSEVALGAGERWTREPVAVAAPIAPSASAPSHSSPPPHHSGSSKPPHVQNGAHVRPEASAPKPAAGTDFMDAMAAFSRGDFATAEARFIEFERRHPMSAQVEDALFLRAVARLRRGDRAGAQALARTYLQRFPAGFRAREASQLAGIESE